MIGKWYLACQPEVVAMSVEVPAGAGQLPVSVQIAEREGWSAPGVRVLVAGIVMLLADAGRLPSKAGEMRRPGRPRSRPPD
jgi:hypothetical protein